MSTCNPCICCTTKNPWYLRGSVVALCMLVFTFMAFGALFAPIVWTDNTELGLWWTCQWSTFGGEKVGACGDVFYSGCDTMKHYIRATRAFYLMTLITGFFAMITAILNAVGKINSKPTLGLIAVTLVFGIVGWILGFYLYFKDFCGAEYSSKALKEKPGFGLDITDSFRIAPSAPVLCGAWGLALITLVLNVALPSCPLDGYPHTHEVQQTLDEIEHAKNPKTKK